MRDYANPCTCTRCAFARYTLRAFFIDCAIVGAAGLTLAALVAPFFFAN
ncbi:MAG: hypothetical protein V4787_11500 [Pseudomonadota bacterium]